MTSRKVKITIFYRSLHNCEGVSTTFIFEEDYLFGFLPSLIREDIERVEVCEYDK